MTVEGRSQAAAATGNAMADARLLIVEDEALLPLFLPERLNR